MLDKVKKSVKISFIALIIFLIALIAFIPVLFNYKQILGIGYFNFKKNFISDYPEGSVGIEININLDYWQDTRCRGVVKVQTISSGNVQVHGVTHIQYEIGVDDRSNFINEIVDPAAQSWSNSFIIDVFEDDNMTCTGIAEVNFSIGGLDQISVLNFDMDYVIPMNVGDIFYVYDLPFIWISFFYFVFLFVVVHFVLKKYRYIKFEYYYTEDMKKRDKKFFKYIERKSRENQEKK